MVGIFILREKRKSQQLVIRNSVCSFSSEVLNTQMFDYFITAIAFRPLLNTINT